MLLTPRRMPTLTINSFCTAGSIAAAPPPLPAVAAANPSCCCCCCCWGASLGGCSAACAKAFVLTNGPRLFSNGRIMKAYVAKNVTSTYGVESPGRGGGWRPERWAKLPIISYEYNNDNNKDDSENCSCGARVHQRMREAWYTAALVCTVQPFCLSEHSRTDTASIYRGMAEKNV